MTILLHFLKRCFWVYGSFRLCMGIVLAQNITFDQAQPLGVKSLQYFPSWAQGKYFNEEDSSYIVIGQTTVVKIYEVEVEEILAETSPRKDGEVFYPEAPKLILPLRKSIFYKEVEVDTLFKIGKGFEIKKYKGRVFLSYAKGDAGWEVERLTFDEYEKEMLIRRIVTPSDAKKLMKLSRGQWEKAPYKFSPSKRAFRKFNRSL